MNKLCPICKKRVSKRQSLSFHEGKKYHKECLEEKLEEERLDDTAYLLEYYKK